MRVDEELANQNPMAGATNHDSVEPKNIMSRTDCSTVPHSKTTLSRMPRMARFQMADASPARKKAVPAAPVSAGFFARAEK